MLRKGSAGLLRQALQYGLQQPVQQSCVQLQVLSLQAVRFRSKPSHPKHLNWMSRAKRQEVNQERMVERALERKGISLNLWEASTAVPTPAAAGDSSSSGAAAQPTAEAGQATADTSSSSSSSSNSNSSSSETNASSSTDSSSSSRNSSVIPDWLRDIVGLPGRRRSRPPAVKASPLTPQSAIIGAADKEQAEKRQQQQTEERLRPQGAPQQQGDAKAGAAADGDSKPDAPDDGWSDAMRQFMDLSLNDWNAFLKFNAKDDDQDPPPRPRKPTRGPSTYYGSLHDQARTQYYRYASHAKFINTITAEDKQRIQADPNIHKDAAAMRHFADSSSLPMDTVRDAITTYHTHRRDYRLVYDYWNAGKKLPPTNDQYGFEVIKRKLIWEHEQRKAKELLKLRDVRQCELKKHAAAVGKAYLRKICPQTELPYGQCCGRNTGLTAKDARRTKQQRLRML